MMYDYYSSVGLIGFLFNILIWAAIIWAIVYFVKKGSGRHEMKFHEENKTSLEMLNERYAKGEIDKKEYEDKKQGILKK